MKRVLAAARAVVAAALFSFGLVFVLTDAILGQVTWVMFLGCVLLAFFFLAAGVFNPRFWMADDETSARCDEVDQELTERGL